MLFEVIGEAHRAGRHDKAAITLVVLALLPVMEQLFERRGGQS
jgi:hypothetical protein